MTILFVGERRSNKAIQMRVRWENGNLAAKTLFDALAVVGIDPKEHRFTNWFERGGKTAVRAHAGPIVAMGQKVQRALAEEGIEFVPLIHPAARGKIRARPLYVAHVVESLSHLVEKAA